MLAYGFHDLGKWTQKRLTARENTVVCVAKGDPDQAESFPLEELR